MPRNPFVWEVQVRREVLDDELARLRGLPFSVWREIVGTPISKIVKGRDNRRYRVRIAAEYYGAGDIHVSMALSHAGGLRRRLLRQTFVITPQNTFRA